MRTADTERPAGDAKITRQLDFLLLTTTKSPTAFFGLRTESGGRRTPGSRKFSLSRLAVLTQWRPVFLAVYGGAYAGSAPPLKSAPVGLASDIAVMPTVVKRHRQ